MPNEMAEDWHQRRRICEAYREKQKELSRNPKSQQLEKEVRDWKARAEEASVLGTLEVGKDATLFISEGDALDMRTSQVLGAFIQGRDIDLNGTQQQLYERFRDKYQNQVE